ncbi:MAG: type II toxin-antitoxin system HicB family antitoxin [Betaproteobacteria bacterium]|nr:type II toxin-antitoxin system HicB family antitoxin [Betaproteobacteria bacterium]
MDILKYKDYEGTAEIDMKRAICRGKILFINDLVTYEAQTPAELQAAFNAAVDDYLQTCKSLGRQPQKSLKGQFNVRMPPALHKAAAVRAAEENASLNDVVVRAVDAFLSVPAPQKSRQRAA